MQAAGTRTCWSQKQPASRRGRLPGGVRAVGTAKPLPERPGSRGGVGRSTRPSPRPPSDLSLAFPLAEPTGRWGSKGTGRQPHGVRGALSRETLSGSAVGSPAAGARRPLRGSRPREQADCGRTTSQETGHEAVSSTSSHMSSSCCGGSRRSGLPHTDPFWKAPHAFSVLVSPTRAAPPLGPGPSESWTVREGDCRHPGVGPFSHASLPPASSTCPPARWLAIPTSVSRGPCPPVTSPRCANNGATTQGARLGPCVLSGFTDARNLTVAATLCGRTISVRGFTSDPETGRVKCPT